MELLAAGNQVTNDRAKFPLPEVDEYGFMFKAIGRITLQFLPLEGLRYMDLDCAVTDSEVPDVSLGIDMMIKLREIRADLCAIRDRHLIGKYLHASIRISR